MDLAEYEVGARGTLLTRYYTSADHIGAAIVPVSDTRENGHVPVGPFLCKEAYPVICTRASGRRARRRRSMSLPQISTTSFLLYFVLLITFPLALHWIAVADSA